MSELHVRLFVASPSDLVPERNRVVAAAARLNGSLEGVVRIETIRWEDDFYSATRSFQEQINTSVAGMAQIDILICILWGRIGLRLDPALWKGSHGDGYESGTVLEYETALDLNRRQGTPDLYLFRKTAPILYRADSAAEDTEQHALLETVWKRWTQSASGYNSAAFQSFADTDEFERQFEGCLRRWLEDRGVLVKGPVWDRRIRGSPFRGLAHFEPSHAAVFFGREAVIGRAIAKLRSADFLLVIGASGAGKSSLLRAGLVPNIARPGVVPDVDLWRVAVMTPSRDVLASLAELLFDEAILGADLRDAGLTAGRLERLVREDCAGAVDALATALGEAARKQAAERGYQTPRPARLLFAIDQLERLFTEARPEDVDAFATLLARLVARRVTTVVASLRSDAYGDLQTVPAFAAMREAGVVLDLLPPSPQELEDIVTRPVLACHPPLQFEVEAGGRSLARRLVADAKGGDSLPLLQLTLERLFQGEKARGDGVLRGVDYPGMDEAVTEAASHAFAAIDEAARACVPALITAFALDVTADTVTGKSIVVLQPVARATFERGRPERKALVDSFLASRLLTIEESGGMARLRPVHEALLRVWPEAVRILAENEATIRVRRTLEPLVARWTETGQRPDSDFLLTSPALLAGADRLVERLGDDLDPSMRRFIELSQAGQARREASEREHRGVILSATGRMSLRSIPYYVPLVLLLMIVSLLVRSIDPPIVQRLRAIAFDTYQRISPRSYDPQLPVRVVDIDEQSLKDYGQWPWPRRLVSELTRDLAVAGAAAIVFDIQFSEPDRWSPEQYLKTLPADKASSLAGVIAPGETNDQFFAATLQQTPSVLAVALDNAGRSSAPETVDPDCLLGSYGNTGLAFSGDCPMPFIPAFANASILPILKEAARGIGAVNYIPDQDDVVRRVGLVYRTGDLMVPSLAAEAIRVKRGDSNYTIVSSNSNAAKAFGAATGINHVDIGDLRIPTDRHGAIFLRFRHGNQRAFIPAAHILSQKVGRADIAGRIVFVGTSVAGAVDLHATPLDAAVSGVEIHEQVVENILGGTLLSRPDFMPAVEIAAVFALCVILALVMPRISARALAAFGTMLIAAIAIGGWAAYVYAGILVDPAYPIVTILVFITIATFYIYRYSESQREKIRRVMQPASARSD